MDPINVSLVLARGHHILLSCQFSSSLFFVWHPIIFPAFLFNKNRYHLSFSSNDFQFQTLDSKFYFFSEQLVGPDGFCLDKFVIRLAKQAGKIWIFSWPKRAHSAGILLVLNLQEKEKAGARWLNPQIRKTIFNTIHFFTVISTTILTVHSEGLSQG